MKYENWVKMANRRAGNLEIVRKLKLNSIEKALFKTETKKENVG
jgi:hypothetical protein